MEVVVNPKVARYIPLGVAGLMVLRELIAIIFLYRFQMNYYFQDSFWGWNFFYTVAIIFGTALKFATFLGLLFIYKVLPDGKVVASKLISGLALLALLIRGVITYIFGFGFHYSTISNIAALLVVIGLVVNFVIMLLAKDPNSSSYGLGKTRQVSAPVAFNPPAQTYASPAGQSVPDQLSALEKLHASGALTDAEFKAAKKKILE